MLAINIISSFVLLIIFGFWQSKAIAWSWFSTVVVAVLIYFLMLEQILDLVFKKFCEKKDLFWSLDIRNVLKFVKKQRKILFERFGEELLRPYFSHLYQPLGEDDIKVKTIILYIFRKT